MSRRSQSVPRLHHGRPRVQSRTRDAPASKPNVGEVLIYLDVDGVLNTTAQRKARQHLDNELIACLRCILDAVPKAAVILSSSWRLQQPLMQALEARFAAEGVKAPVGVTGQAPLPERDPIMRGDAGSIDVELARLAAQRAAEIHASVLARQPQAWIAIDDLDLRPPSQSTLRAGYPPRLPQQGQCDGASGRLPPLPVRRPFTLSEQRANLPAHPLAARVSRRRPSRGLTDATRPQPLDTSIESEHFVHTSEAAGLTRERAEFGIALLQAQLEKCREPCASSIRGRACSH
mmetsp:Transcript_38980/g.69209  ORF Transcript_38980/g.69209 Transcript_38980/m.69209 type:complete len:290 (-) Transcript_38980:121-990(-)